MDDTRTNQKAQNTESFTQHLNSKNHDRDIKLTSETEKLHTGVLDTLTCQKEEGKPESRSIWLVKRLTQINT